MKWTRFPFDFFTGSENMEIDSSLAELNHLDNIYFRMYRWKPYCVSLGANQSNDILNLDNLGEDEIDFVKRPTGGKAVFHAGELTYSVVFPIDNYFTPKKIYEEINSALITGLSFYHLRLMNLSLEKEVVNFRNEYKHKFSEACFSVPNKNELKFELKKIVGSAQRKVKNVVIQHGSILCTNEHLAIFKYLKLSDEEKKYSENKLRQNTTELETVLNERINYENLSSAISAGMEKHFNMEFEHRNLDEFVQPKLTTALF